MNVQLLKYFICAVIAPGIYGDYELQAGKKKNVMVILLLYLNLPEMCFESIM